MIVEARFEEAAAALRQHGIEGPVDCALVLGTGLGGIVEDIADKAVVPFRAIPGFPHGHVSGHARQVSLGTLHGKRVLVLEGRAHYYETGDASSMRVPIGMLTALGAPPLILTNACGSLRPDLPPGSLAVITDHINLNAPNPLVGDSGDARFVPMVGAYDADLRQRLQAAAKASEIALGEGVYMWFSGPSFETPAEIRMARTLGPDLVGMSTVPEVILARRYGLRVAGLSAITNMGAGLHGGDPSHDETKAVASRAAESLRRLLGAFLSDLP
jgi:purine-nucleoside phosphorylase